MSADPSQGFAHLVSDLPQYIHDVNIGLGKKHATKRIIASELFIAPVAARSIQATGQAHGDLLLAMFSSWQASSSI